MSKCRREVFREYYRRKKVSTVWLPHKLLTQKQTHRLTGMNISLEIRDSAGIYKHVITTVPATILLVYNQFLNISLLRDAEIGLQVKHAGGHTHTLYEHNVLVQSTVGVLRLWHSQTNRGRKTERVGITGLHTHTHLHKEKPQGHD